MKSIQTKILVVVIVGLLIMTLTISSIAINTTHDIMHTDADRILNNACEKEAAYINGTLNRIESLATVMAHYATTELEDIDILKNEDTRNKYLETCQVFLTELAINTPRVESFYIRLNPDIAGPQSGLYNIVSNGIIIPQELTDFSKYSADNESIMAWYTKPVEAGMGTWIEPYEFSTIDTTIISYVVPFYSEHELVGVIGFDINFKYLLDKVKSISVYDKGYATLLSENLKEEYIIHPHEESLKDHTHTYARASLVNGMHLELRTEYKDIQKDIRPILKKITITFIVIFCASVIYTILVTRSIIKPLKKLTKAAEDVAEGNWSNDLEIKAKDEIGTLSTVLSNTYNKLREYTAYINALAYKDSLTGLKNNTAYIEMVNEMNRKIRLENVHFAVMVADLNNLKETNDTHGHDAGNELLIHTAKILTDTFKQSPVFRIGGDEFVVILYDKDYENYKKLLDEMDNNFAQDFITAHDGKINVSIARGIAVYNPDIDNVFEDVFNNADDAMYLHKQEYKGNK